MLQSSSLAQLDSAEMYLGEMRKEAQIKSKFETWYKKLNYSCSHIYLIYVAEALLWFPNDFVLPALVGDWYWYSSEKGETITLIDAFHLLH